MTHTSDYKLLSKAIEATGLKGIQILECTSDPKVHQSKAVVNGIRITTMSNGFRPDKVFCAIETDATKDLFFNTSFLEESDYELITTLIEKTAFARPYSLLWAVDSTIRSALNKAVLVNEAMIMSSSAVAATLSFIDKDNEECITDILIHEDDNNLPGDYSYSVYDYDGKCLANFEHEPDLDLLIEKLAVAIASHYNEVFKDC